MARVALLIDWQNTYKTACEAFGWDDWPNEYGNFSPYALARELVAANERGEGAELVRVFVYRGLPSNRIDPVGYGANRRQSAAWMAENPEIVVPKLRPLSYLGDEDAPREKGIDVLLAIDALEWILTDRCDVAIVFSHDTDLLPVVDAIARLRGAGYVETVSRSSERFRARLRPAAAVYHHSLDFAAFTRVERRVNDAREHQ